MSLTPEQEEAMKAAIHVAWNLPDPMLEACWIAGREYALESSQQAELKVEVWQSELLRAVFRYPREAFNYASASADMEVREEGRKVIGTTSHGYAILEALEQGELSNG